MAEKDDLSNNILTHVTLKFSSEPFKKNYKKKPVTVSIVVEQRVTRHFGKLRKLYSNLQGHKSIKLNTVQPTGAVLCGCDWNVIALIPTLSG